MAYPTYYGNGLGTAGTTVTSRTPPLPSSLSNGMLLIAFCHSKNNDTHSCSTSGWSKIDQVSNGTAMTVSLWAYKHTSGGTDGSETAPVITWTNGANAYARMFALDGSLDLTSGPFGASNSNTGTGTTHSCTGVSSTRDESLMFYVNSHNTADTSPTPTGWTERIDNGDVSRLLRTSTGDKDVATSGGSSGDISITSGNAEWVMYIYEVKSAATSSVKPAYLFYQ